MGGRQDAEREAVTASASGREGVDHRELLSAQDASRWGRRRVGGEIGTVRKNFQDMASKTSQHS